jgi:hypothetical protein
MRDDVGGRGGNVGGVSLRDRARKRLAPSVADLDRARLQDRYQGLDITSIGDITLRMPARVGGEVQGLRVVPRSGSSSLEVTVTDGSGRAVAVFLGRRSIAGVVPGVGVVLEGVARKEGGRTVLINPAYTLLAH